MSFRRFPGCVLSVLILAQLPGDAQEAAKKNAPASAATSTSDVPDGGMPRYIRPETPEERMKRLATKEDPGINPDPAVKWYRHGTVFTIRKVDKSWVTPTPHAGWVKSHPNVNIIDELYQENDKWVWIWVPEPPPRRTREERREALKTKEYSDQAIEYMKKIRPEYEPLEPPRSETKVRFEAASKGLPTDGSWRNALDVADMNGDGHMDLIVPSERGAASGTPSIYLGDSKGNWKLWSAKWPYRIDYGAAAAADFNKDKKMDVAFAVHLEGVIVLLGDGKGGFTEVKRDRKFPSRRILATDIDADGWTDVVALWEGPLARGKELRDATYSGLRAYLNRDNGQKWEGVNLSERGHGVSGDWLTAGNFNGDKRPDLLGSTMYSNSTHTLFLSDGDGARYGVYEDESGVVIPGRGTYQAVTSGPFTSKIVDDAIMASSRSWPEKLDPAIVARPPLQNVIALDRLSFHEGKPTRTTIMRFPQGRPILGLSHGDFDRDGKEDIIFTRHDPREAVLLMGDGKGGFRRAQVEGLTIAPQKNYDLVVADVNRDARPDVIVMYESDSATALSTKNGSIQVFLNRGTGE
ncbi:MAG TPA: VCBS repeat-containing protein [Thermoanaerobaculia bacterium]|nr:VCBS repeat-containing protein [Thermoanaerobaculia bacterium]